MHSDVDLKRYKFSVGLMQGRLTPPLGRGIQFFPFENWEKEFYAAKRIGLNEIEFVFDFYKYRENPLWSKKGRERIRNIISKTGIKINSICADYFMRRPFFRVSRKRYFSNIKILEALIKYASEIGASLIEIPLVDNSSIKGTEEERVFVNAIRSLLPLVEKNNVKIDFETDLPARKFRSLLNKFNHLLVGANYDTGNSAFLGYDSGVEVRALAGKIFNVHIKDKIYRGNTVKLGKGDVKFDKFFKSLKLTGYRGSYILQAARGKDGKEEQTIKKQIKFLEKWI
jgi:L-ribulose-5-phosphate 3-epimerase